MSRLGISLKDIRIEFFSSFSSILSECNKISIQASIWIDQWAEQTCEYDVICWWSKWADRWT